MFDGVVKSMLAVLGIAPEEAGQMARDVVSTVESVDKRLSTIESNQMAMMKAMNIEMKGAENGEHDNVIGIESGAAK